MHKRDIVVEPKYILRDNFVKLIFRIARQNQLGLDTVMTAVTFGDKFESYGEKSYSVELAHVVIGITAKFNEDDQKLILQNSWYEIENKYIFGLERKVLETLDYHIRIHNFMTVIGDILFQDNIDPCVYHTIFYDLCLEICLNKELLYKDPTTLIIGVVILYKRGWLKAINNNKQRRLKELRQRICREYDLDIIDVTKVLRMQKS